jgi:AraC family transcriptional regulator
MTPHVFVTGRRVTAAHKMLTETDLPIVAIASAVGFADQSHLARRFREAFGVSPLRLRRAKA